MKSKGWCVVIGKPVLSKWKANQFIFWPQPEAMSQIGNTLFIGQYFATREEARACAKRQSKDNMFWRYHAKKIP